MLVIVNLDTDRNPATGQSVVGLGADYVISMGDGQNDHAMIGRYVGGTEIFSSVGGVPATFLPDGMDVTVPLSLLGNSDGRLKAGMFADIEIVTTVLNNVLLIPDDALQTDGENQIVFVALDGNKFEKRVVKLGLEQQGRVQVLEGVKAGEKIVTQGSFILKSEMLKAELGEE